MLKSNGKIIRKDYLGGNLEDHYVAQTYLKHFNNPAEKLLVYNKELVSIEEKHRKNVCREEGGSNNPFFEKERIIEDYLVRLENNWNSALSTFLSLFSSEGKYSAEEYLKAKFIISGYLSFLRVAPPARVQGGQDLLKNMLGKIFEVLKAQGEIPPPPKGMEFLLDQIKFEVDPKYPQALGFSSVPDLHQTFYKAPWHVIYNISDVPFITSDNPVSPYCQDNSGREIIYAPLSPKIGVLINPFLTLSEVQDQSSLCDRSFKTKQGDTDYVWRLNKIIVEWAEELVIANWNEQKILDLIRECKNWRYRLGNASAV